MASRVLRRLFRGHWMGCHPSGEKDGEGWLAVENQKELREIPRDVPIFEGKGLVVFAIHHG